VPEEDDPNEAMIRHAGAMTLDLDTSEEDAVAADAWLPSFSLWLL
jgi:hypothetical protein